MTYNTIRGQFLQAPNWSRFRPTELPNFAKNGGFLGKENPEMFNFQDLPNVKSFKSGATRNRTGDTRIFSPLLYHLSYGTVFCFDDAKIGHFSIFQNFGVKFLSFFVYLCRLR